MSKLTWACFACRVAVRREGKSMAAVRCPACGKGCENLGTRIPVPPKKDAKAWEQVRSHLSKVRADKAKQAKEGKAHIAAFLARQIAKLESLPPNRDRTKELKRLRAALLRVK